MERLLMKEKEEHCALLPHLDVVERFAGCSDTSV